MTNQVRAYRYGLDAKAIGWIEDVLSNDESSTNAELVEYFLKQGLSRLQAESVLRHREDYLLNLYRIREGPLHATQDASTTEPGRPKSDGEPLGSPSR